MPNIQQMEIPSDCFGPLAEFSGNSASEHDVDQCLQEHGYVVLRRYIPTALVRAARLEVFSRLYEVGEVAEPIAEGLLTGSSQRSDPDEDDGAFWKSVSVGAALRRVTHGAEVRALMSTVLGTPPRAHDLLYLRPMPRGEATALHYDYPFFAGESERIYTVWIPFGDVPLCDGPLVIVERSFEFDDLLDPIRCIDFSVDRSNDAVQAAAYQSPNRIHPVALAQERQTRLLSSDFAAGDVVVFSGFTLHGSLDNDSSQNRLRLSCDVRYQPAADSCADERYFGADPKGSKGRGYADMRGARPLA